MVKKKNKNIMLIVLVVLGIYAFSQGTQFTGYINAESEEQLRNYRCPDYPGADIYECIHPTAGTLYCLDSPVGTCKSVNENNGYVCINTQTPCAGNEITCTETDGGENWGEKGSITYTCEGQTDTAEDYCYGNNLIEFSCSNIDNPSCLAGGIQVDCGDLACIDGECVEKPKCVDSDGQDKTIKGRVYMSNTPNDYAEDECIGGLQVREYYCVGETGIGSNVVDCDSGDECKNGACVESDYVCDSGATSCDGRDYVVCESNSPVNKGKVKGKCGVECLAFGDCEADEFCNSNDKCEPTASCDDVCSAWSYEDLECGTRTCPTVQDPPQGGSAVQCQTEIECDRGDGDIGDACSDDIECKKSLYCKGASPLMKGICDCQRDPDTQECAARTCSEDDGGKVYGKAGYMVGTDAYGTYFEYEDTCKDTSTLKEYFCDGTVGKVVEYPCGTGNKCDGGKCLTPDDPDDPDDPKECKAGEELEDGKCVSKCAPWQQWSKEENDCELNMGVIILFFAAIIGVKMMRN